MKFAAAALALFLGFSAYAQSPVSTKQYGLFELDQTAAKDGTMQSSVKVTGWAAYAIYLGMKDVQETNGALAGTKMKIGENISCIVGLYQQATCDLAFEQLATGRLK